MTMIRPRYILFSLLVVGCCVLNPAFGQRTKVFDKSAKGQKFVNKKPTEASSTKKSGKDTTDEANIRTTVRSWDTNNDGVLEKSEIPAQQQRKVYSAAKAKGMDLKQPLKIKVLLGKMSQAEKDAKKAAKKELREEQKANQKNANPKAFGANAQSRTENKAQAEPGEETKKTSRGQRTAMFAAKSLMYQHDKNKNGRLEKSEWRGLKGNPKTADTNKDGSLSMKELSDHLAGFGSREEKVRPRRKGPNTYSSDGKKRSYRFLTAHERLPEGLPDWFTERDENQDGQINLREYAPSLTAAKYDKFVQLDLNNDGLLVAKEYLEATK